MAEHQYNAAIKIISKIGPKDLDTAVEMSSAEGIAFVNRIKKLLDELTGLKLGRKLLQDVENAGKPVTIFCAKAGTGSAASPFPGSVENEMKRFILLRQIPEKAVEKLRKQGYAGKIPEARFYAAEFTGALRRSRANLQVLMVLLGLTADDIIDIMLGDKALTANQYVRFALFMYPHLSRGEGCSVCYRFEEAQANPALNDTPLIILAHELIHAWRMVRGERIFEGGWEEEAMTVGLPPFLNTEINENKLRCELSAPLRTSYTARCTTGHFQVVQTFGGDNVGKGLWPEQLAAWDRWKDKNKALVEQWEKDKKAGKFKFFKNAKEADKAKIAHLLYNTLD